MPAPGKSHREGISLFELFEMFPDEETAVKWFEAQRWGEDGSDHYCPRCGSYDVAHVKSEKPMRWRCRSCRTYHSVRTNTPLENSNVPLRKWAIAIYRMLTSLKSVASTKLRRDIKVTQSTAWFMMHRLRQAWANDKYGEHYDGPVEVDETYVGGERKNKHKSVRQELEGRGPVDMVEVVGAKDRKTKRIVAEVVDDTTKATLQGFVKDHVNPGSTVYTDEHKACCGLPLNHEAVAHSLDEWVKGDCHINGLEGEWSLFKRSIVGVFHKVSPKHLQRYLDEYAAKRGIRDQDTLDQMSATVAGLVGQRLLYVDLIKPNGLSSGAKPTSAR